MGVDIGNPVLVKDLVYYKLKERIIEGYYLPGDRIIEQKIAEEFDISRTPLREAINKLEIEGLLTRLNSGGVMITKLKAEEIEEIYEVRILLEKNIINYLCKNINEKELSSLRKIVSKEKERLERNCESKEAIKNAIIQSDQFHEQLYKIYGNKIYIKIYKELKAQTQRYIFLSLSEENRYKGSCKEHIDIFNLIEKGQAEKAVKEIEKHILHAQKSAIESLKKL